MSDLDWFGLAGYIMWMIGFLSAIVLYDWKLALILVLFVGGNNVLRTYNREIKKRHSL